MDADMYVNKDGITILETEQELINHVKNITEITPTMDEMLSNQTVYIKRVPEKKHKKKQ